ncbi:hypothetical protein C8R48DRAFT_447422 [Suillus tomentosus]|nr:hypothetical protein C8R48DRAFT_447422 [Suillus tomentosus]
MSYRECWTEDVSVQTGIEDPEILYGGRPAYDKTIGFIQKAKDVGGEVLIRGTGDDSKGYFIQPTIIPTEDQSP